MPWQEVSIMSSREEFVELWKLGGVSLAELCRRFGVSRKTGYKWSARAQAGESLSDRSRRPRRSPIQTLPSMEARVLDARARNPAWGGRKLASWLKQRGVQEVPSPSTITAILHRHGLITAEASRAVQAWTRFERAQPNELWQMDFKGHVPMARGGRCHPFTVLDDHSRYCIGLRACSNEREETVQDHLIDLFRVHGLPERILCDNGAPWGTAGEAVKHTALTVWMLKLGVSVTHGRPYHPQTQGKEERFHRTVKSELLSRVDLLDIKHSQAQFDPWRNKYNHERPHEALGDATPSTRYKPSKRTYPERPTKIEYDDHEIVRRVSQDGIISYKGVQVRVGKAFEAERVAIRATGRENVVRVCLGPYEMGEVDLSSSRAGPHRRPTLATLARSADADQESATHVSERV